MTKNLRYILIGVISAIIIGAIILEMRAMYSRMQAECEKMGGKFYSISFTQNICIDGNVVYELK